MQVLLMSYRIKFMIHSLEAEYLVHLSCCSVTTVAVLLQCGLYFLTFNCIINVQRDARIRSLYFILLQDHSTCFGCLSHPSSGVHETCRVILQ